MNSTPRVREDADPEAVDRGPAGDQAGAVERLVLVDSEPSTMRAITSRVERHAQVDGPRCRALFGRIAGLHAGGRRPELSPVEGRARSRGRCGCSRPRREVVGEPGGRECIAAPPSDRRRTPRRWLIFTSGPDHRGTPWPAGRRAPSSRTCRARTHRRRSSSRTGAIVGMPIADSSVSRGRSVPRARRDRPAWGGRRRPTRRGSRAGGGSAISSARRFFFSVYGFIDPPHPSGPAR